MGYATIQIQAEWQFVSGKFAQREGIIEALIAEVESGPDSIDVDDGTYEVVTWEIEEVPEVKPLSRKQLIEKLMPACAVLGIADKRKIEQFIELYTASGGRLS